MKVTAHPREVDTNITTLFKKRRRRPIGPGESIIVKGNYKDEVGGNETDADDATMIEPAAVTDYTLFTNFDGTGTDLTSDCSIVSDFGTSGFECTVTNGSDEVGYLFLKIRGYRIFGYDPIDYEVKDSVSYTAYGYEPKTLDQIYQQELDTGILAADSVVDLEKDPRVILKKVTFWNTTDELNLAFLNLDVGDIVCIKEDQSEIDGYYYIQAVEFSLHPKGMIMFSWIVRQLFVLGAGLSLIGVEFTHPTPGANNVINYGHITSISKCNRHRTISAWVYLHSYPDPGDLYTIVTNSNSGGINGTTINIQGDGQIVFLQDTTGVSAAIWTVPLSSVPLNAWTNIVTTRNSANYTAAPLIYVDGVSLVVTEDTAPPGQNSPENDSRFKIGNSTLDGFDGIIADVRVYNRVITPTEAAQIHSDGYGVNGVKNGLVFQGPAVRTKDLTLYTDLTLTSAYKVLDTIYGYVGSPIGSPVSRILP
jgi:hypothetical protein